MDAPAVRYVQASDGARIAYWTRGSGPPLVEVPSIQMSHLRLEWDIPAVRNWYEQLASSLTVVRFDDHGAGLSRSAAGASLDLSIEALARDIELVVDELGLDRFALCGRITGGLPAIAYAAARPERVSHLVLWNTSAGEAARGQAPRIRSLLEMAGTDWEAFTESLAQAALGWGDSEAARQWASVLRAATSPDAFLAYLEARRSWDVSSLLEQVSAPTLVMYDETNALASEDFNLELAAGIADAQLIAAQGESGMPDRAATSQILEFVSDTEPQRPAEAQPGLQTILFTDLEASTPLTQRLGDEGAQELLRGHNATVRGALAEHGGREVKHTGDGIMASFPSAVAAVTAGLQIQRELADGEVRVRVGLNAGEPIVEDEDLFGLSVIKAARVADRAEPGQVLVTDVVRQLCEGKTFRFASLGAVSLKGFDEPVELFEVAG